MSRAFIRTRIVDDQWDQVLGRLRTGIEVMKMRTGNAIAEEAIATAPVSTGPGSGHLKSSIVDDNHGLVYVGAYYAPFVNYGTRYMNANPWFSWACAGIGVDTMQRELRDVLGHGAGMSIVKVTEPTPYKHGEDRGQRRPYNQQKAMFANMKERGR